MKVTRLFDRSVFVSGEKPFQRVEDTARQVVPKQKLGIIIGNIGLPAPNDNFAFGDVTPVA